MPITKAEFEKGVLEDENYKAVEKFLNSNADNAFTAEEIVIDLYFKGKKPDPGLDIIIAGQYFLQLYNIKAVLEKMVIEGKIVKRTIKGNDYFRWAV
jgi:hypothetical protein